MRQSSLPRILVAASDVFSRSRLELALSRLLPTVRSVDSGWRLLDALADDEPWTLVVAGTLSAIPSALSVAAMAAGAGVTPPFLVVAERYDHHTRAAHVALGHVQVLTTPEDVLDVTPVVVTARKMLGDAARRELRRAALGRGF